MDFTLFAVLPGKLQHEQVRKYANLARAVSHGEKLGASALPYVAESNRFVWVHPEALQRAVKHFVARHLPEVRKPRHRAAKAFPDSVPAQFNHLTLSKAPPPQQPMSQFVVWELRGVRYLGHRPDERDAVSEGVKRLPDRA